MFRRYKVWYDRAKAKGKLNREGVLMSLGVKIIIVVCDNKKESGGSERAKKAEFGKVYIIIMPISIICTTLQLYK